MIGCTIRLKKRRAGESEWLVNLLGSKFFGACVDHRDLRKNEKNVFCIDCNLCFCKHCIISSPHSSSSSSSSNSNPCVQFHRRLQICRYVYHDVVRLLDIQKHLDCSKIQTYKINGEKAVHLNPRPQLTDAKTCKSKGGASCEACGRHIQDLPNRFCSIACKVLLVAEMTKEDTHKRISYPIPDFGDYSCKANYDVQGNMNESESTLSSTGSFEEIEASWLSSKLRPKKLLHKRKGVPRRAPLC